MVLGLVVAGPGSGLSESRCGDESRPRWSQSRFPVALPGSSSNWPRRVVITQPPTDIGTAVVAVLDDTCGNLIQLIEEKPDENHDDVR